MRRSTGVPCSMLMIVMELSLARLTTEITTPLTCVVSFELMFGSLSTKTLSPALTSGQWRPFFSVFNSSCCREFRRLDALFLGVLCFVLATRVEKYFIGSLFDEDEDEASAVFDDTFDVDDEGAAGTDSA